MANFKLRLITPNNDRSFSINDLNSTETFLTSLITDYQGQVQEYQQNAEVEEDNFKKNGIHHSVSYTYDEKISLHKNGQKELTFNIDDKIFSNNEGIENPYARILRVGTQLELTDKYNNCFLFTVNKVGYSFHNTNIVYNITCQDSFTYQLTRQNQGYTLNNDTNSSDFIGALDIDSGAKKIATDCYLTYQYVPLNQGIYLDTDGLIRLQGAFGQKDDIQNSQDTVNVQKIIKPIYSYQKYPDYYETFPFSASGSSALAALIALGETLGLQLNIVEGHQNITTEEPVKYTRYFFFGPTKNTDVSGLTYSPLRDIQSFSLNFVGDSLTTVLNVKSTTGNDEEIGLIPNVPDFFISQILTDSNGTNSRYYPGYFLELIKGLRYSDAAIFSAPDPDPEQDTNFQSFVEENVDPEETSYLVLGKVNKNILSSWPLCYNQIQFSGDGDHRTTLAGFGETITSKGHEMGLATLDDHPHALNIYSLYNIGHQTLADPNSPQNGNYTTVFQIPDTITFNSNFVQQDGDFLYQNETYRCTILKNGTHYYVYLLKENIKNTLYEHIDNNFDYTTFVDGFLAQHMNTYIVPTEYQGDSEDKSLQYIFFPEYTDIPTKYLNEFNEGNREFYFYIRHTPFAGHGNYPQILNTYIRLGRKYTKEEGDFAEIAEACPGLENKLIDFSYFYKLGIISRAEYENLIDFITNDVRIINGQLMCYASTYYQALHEQVTLLATLQENVDKIGALFYADIVDAFANSGNIKLNTGDFATTYNELFNGSQEANQRKPLLRLNNVISDYFNKYFNAEQRFLKNIYNFRHFFDSQNIYSNNYDTIFQNVLYSIHLQEDDDTSSSKKIHVGFNHAVSGSEITEDETSIVVKHTYGNDYYQYSTNVDVYQGQNGHYILKNIPNVNNYKDFYVPLGVASNPFVLKQTVAYNPKNTYFLSESKFDEIFPNEDKTKYESFTKTGLVNDNEVTMTYYQLDYSHILQLFLYNNPNKYYIRDFTQKVPLDGVRCDCSTVQTACSIYHGNGLDTAIKCFTSGLNLNLDQSHFNTYWSFYKALTPFEGIYVQDYNLQYTVDNTDNTKYQGDVVDENNHPYKVEGDVNSGYKGYKYDLQKQDYDMDTILTTDDLYTAFYEIPMINFKDNMSALFGSTNAVSTSVGNILTLGNSINNGKNAATFYAHTKRLDGSTFGKDYTKTGGDKQVGLYPVGWKGLGPIFDNGVAADTTDGDLCTFQPGASQGREGEKNEAIPKNGKDDSYLLGKYSKHYAGDSVGVNYIKSATGEEEIKQFTSSIILDKTIRKLYPVIDSSQVKAQYISWKHYSNYYSKIAISYSTGSLVHDSARDLIDDYYNTDVGDSNHVVTTSNISYANMFTYQVGTILNNYDAGEKGAKLGTRNKYARFCTLNDLLNPNDTYIGVKAGENNIDLDNLPAAGSDDETKKFYVYFNRPDNGLGTPKVTDRFSAIKFYPLVEGKETIRLDSVFTTEELKNHEFTVKDFLHRIDSNITQAISENEYVFKLPPQVNSNQTSYYCILHLEPYEKCIINNTTDHYTNPHNYYCLYNNIQGAYAIYKNKYDITTVTQAYSDQQLRAKDLMIYPFFEETQGNDPHLTATRDILVLSDEDVQLVKVSELKDVIDNLNASQEGEPLDYVDPWYQDDTHWYETDDLDSRVYTLKQSFQTGEDKTVTYYYLKNSQYQTSEFTKNSESTQQTFTVFVTKYDVDNNGTVLLDNTSREYTVQCTFNNDAEQWSDDLLLDDVKIKIQRQVLDFFDIRNMSNGEFGYVFHNRIDIPNILSKVAVIETQLTAYWTQALSASNYCQGFIPPSGMPNDNKNKNYFSNLLYSIQADNHLILSNRVIPDVEIYTYEGESLLPAYTYHYTGDVHLTNGDTFIEDMPYLNHNPALLASINQVFNEEVSAYHNNMYNFTAQEGGLMTYYYNNGGGLKFSDVLHTLNNQELIYPKFDGLYIMQLKILLTQYVESATQPYEMALSDKLELWQRLYARFPGIFLESTYENKDARTSKQLLQMAQLAFKDYMNPEAQYNISIIDAYALEGYQGQELHVGDGILVKASEYYDAVDETYRALNQYLFISDISYSLRSDDNISLTVNIIKYQDKLLQSIVKLIR